MTESQRPEMGKFRALLAVILSGQAVLIIGLLASITQIVESKWLDKLFAMNILRGISYTLNVILSVTLVYSYYKLKNNITKYNSEMISTISVHSEKQEQENVLWKRLVRILRSFLLDYIPNPTERESLEPMLDELSRRLPNHGIGFKLAISKPLQDGKFKILANRGWIQVPYT